MEINYSVPSAYSDDADERIGTRDSTNLAEMLVQQLRELEAANIVTRKVYQQVPPRVEYGLSDYGRSLSVVLHELCVWGEDNIDRRRAAGEEIALLHRDDL